MSLPTTGKAFVKSYKCNGCGAQSRQETNHYGETYGRCRSCGANPSVHTCLDPLPVGMARPEPWKIVKLSDVAEIIKAA